LGATLIGRSADVSELPSRGCHNLLPAQYVWRDILSMCQNLWGAAVIDPEGAKSPAAGGDW
jgi:hypothetical protein